MTDRGCHPGRAGQRTTQMSQLQHERCVRLKHGGQVVEEIVVDEGKAVRTDGHRADGIGVDTPDLGHPENADGVQRRSGRPQRGDDVITCRGQPPR